MAKKSAHIRSPDVLRRFRHCFVEFDELSRVALDTVTGDVRSVLHWLKQEQQAYWELQLRRRDEAMKKAWRDYVNARYADRRTGKPSCVDERKEWERAKRRRAEAEAKIRYVKGWVDRLEQEAERIMPHCRRYDQMVCHLTPKALARLDHMLDNLEDYLRPSAPKSE